MLSFVVWIDTFVVKDSKNRLLKKKKSNNHDFSGTQGGAPRSICNLRLNLPRFNDFNDGLNENYHFIVKELWNESEGQFKYLWEPTKKLKSFSVSVEKLIKMLTWNYNRFLLKVFINTTRFRPSLLSNLFQKSWRGNL